MCSKGNQVHTRGSSQQSARSSFAQEIGEGWHDRWRGTDHSSTATSKPSEESVADDSARINWVECLWSLLNPWLRKFCGLSKPGLEQSIRVYGLVRTPNLTGAPPHGLLDCFVSNVFR